MDLTLKVFVAVTGLEDLTRLFSRLFAFVISKSSQPRRINLSMAWSDICRSIMQIVLVVPFLT